MKIGDKVSGGNILGYVQENSLFEQHHIMVPPKIHGTIIDISPERDGMYTV
jgi:V-type H+-transporting ATPase subunit A